MARVHFGISLCAAARSINAPPIMWVFRYPSFHGITAMGSPILAQVIVQLTRGDIPSETTARLATRADSQSCLSVEAGSTRIA